MKSFLGAFFAVSFTVLLCIFPDISISAAYNALILCGRVIIPSLFPFFVFSSLIMSGSAAKPLCRLFSYIMRPLFGLGGTCAMPLALGLLSGYPMGAHLTSRLYKSGAVSKHEAHSLLAFANNSGPLFIIGAVGIGIYGNLYTGYYLYAIHVLSAIITGVIIRFFTKKNSMQSLPVCSEYGSDTLPDAVKSAVMSVLNLCGFIIFFSVILKLMERAGITTFIALILCRVGLDADTAALLSGGVFEITTALSAYPDAALPAVEVVISLGGLSVLLQTMGCTSEAGLSVKPYIAGKIICSFVSLILCVTTLPYFPAAVPAAAMEQSLTAQKLRLFTIYILFTAAVCIFLLILLVITEFAEKRKQKKYIPHKKNDH